MLPRFGICFQRNRIAGSLSRSAKHCLRWTDLCAYSGRAREITTSGAARNSVGFPAPRHHQLCRHRHLSIRTARRPAGSRSSSLVLFGRESEESQKKTRSEASDGAMALILMMRLSCIYTSHTIDDDGVEPQVARILRSSPFCSLKHLRLSNGNGRFFTPARSSPSTIHLRLPPSLVRAVWVVPVEAFQSTSAVMRSLMYPMARGLSLQSSPATQQ